MEDVGNSRGGRKPKPRAPPRGKFRRGGGNERLSHKVAKKYQEKAQITALITTNKSFSLQRLMRDYNEIKNQILPVAGVSAHPLETDFFEWHGNIKALAQNIYKGAVMHFKFVFPQNYPLTAPKIYLLNENFVHPNVMTDGAVCLDMLEPKKELYKGWRSGYTALSILLQLQNFFFDIEEHFLEGKDKLAISKSVQAMNEFNCKTCKHKGTTNPWPEFIKGDQDPALHTMSLTKYKESLFRELSCYHRKTTFEETPLGLGINILKIPRTGEIKGLVPCLDFVSLKAYTKERIRSSMSGEHFTHWFPIYFGYQPERFMHRCTKTLSMICTGTTKQFRPEMVLKVMPKFFTNLVADIISEKVYSSCRALKIMIYIYRIALMLTRNFPPIKDEIEAHLFKFINDPASRHKDYTTSLGDLMTMMTLSSKFKIEDILPAYIDEQMDRQIFWILQALPDFETIIHKSEVDDIRAKVCFKAGIVGCQILLFYYFFIKRVLFKENNPLENIEAKLDMNYGNLTEEEIESHRKEIEKILKIDSYQLFYKYLNITPPSDKNLNEKLKNSYVNSLMKGYHGKDEVRFVPEPREQVKLYLSKYPKIYELLVSKPGDKAELVAETDPIWKTLVTEKFDQVVRMRYRYPAKELTPFEVARYYEDLKSEYDVTSQPHVFENQSKIKNHFKYYEYSKPKEDDVYLASLSWRQVYLKFYIELYLKYFQYIADFQYLYDLLKIAKEEIIHLNLDIYSADNLKSDYHYLRVVLSNLVKLRHLHITYHETVTIKMIKNIIKGITNFTKEKGELYNLKISIDKKIYPESHADYNILTIIDKLPVLRVLDVSGTKLDYNSSLRIRNHLYYYKSIEMLDISNCSLTDDMAKEIADGIMKAKSLEKIFISNNQLSKGLSSILYNLAFQPSLKVLDISSTCTNDALESASALYKLIKMSQSLEVLICKDIPGLLNALTSDFFYSLGDNTSIQYVDLSRSGTLSYSGLLGSAVAFNALKNGALKTLILCNNGLSYQSLIDIVEGMKVSEDIHFSWYGYYLNSSISKDSKEYYQKTFYCNLTHLDLSNNNFHCNVNINDLKQTNNVNYLRTLLENDRALESLNFSWCTINKYFIDMIVNALIFPNGLKFLSMEYANLTGDQIKVLMNAFSYTKEKDKEKTLNEHMKLEGLDLGNNRFGYSGIEALSKMLKENKTLKVLNLFHNLFDVNGARRLKDALQVNQTLEAIDISYNRIKDLGFANVIEGILSNENSHVKFLGCRYNFVKNATLSSVMKDLLSNQASKIHTIELSNNSFDEKTINSLFNDVYLKSTKKIHTEIFEILHFLQPEKLERTVWISPLFYNDTKRMILDAIKSTERTIIGNESSHLGIPLKITIKRGRKLGEKKTSRTVNAFIEFIHPNSANRLLKVAATGGFLVNKKKMRVYKAGSKPERLLIKKKGRK